MVHKLLVTRLLTFITAFTLSFGALAEPLLNGLAIHNEFGRQQFIGAFYADTLSDSYRDAILADENKRLEVRVLAERISSRGFKRMWIEGMAINAGNSELSKQAENMAAFSNMLKVSLRSGDIFSVSRSNVVTVELNGVKLGEIDDPVFFDLLLRTWIGPVPLSSTFRSDLLKAGVINDEVLATFEATSPTPERIAVIEQRQGGTATEESAEIEDKKTSVVSIAPPVGAPFGGTIAINSPAPVNETPKAEKKEEDKPTPKKETPPPRAKPPVQLVDSDDLLEEEEEDTEFTASSLLSEQLYISRLKRWLQPYVKYPRRALERDREGTTRLAVRIGRDGEVQSIQIVEESGHSILDKEAMQAIKRASPFPTMPDEVKGDSFSFTLPVIFIIQG